MNWKDFNEHVLIVGGSGSGKTSTVLHQIYEGLVFKTVDRLPPEMQSQYRLGGLVIEAKGDFALKTEILAGRYQREVTVIYFGPDHPEFVYDPFGDPDELPLQKATKMFEIVKAASGGKEGSDPFWSQAAQKLMTNLFLLHDALRRAGKEVPPLSFRYLSLLCMDKGGEEAPSVSRGACSEGLRGAFTRLREILAEMDWEFESVWSRGDRDGFFQQRLYRIRQNILKMQSEHPDGFENRAGKLILESIEETREAWGIILGNASLMNAKLVRQKIAALFTQAESASMFWRQLAKSSPAEQERGALVLLLEKYAELMEGQGSDLNGDLMYTYFKNEYLNPSNEKTSASISMIVSNALMPFVTEPLARLFSPQATFDFSKTIEQGLLVVLDMPTSRYGMAQVLVSLVMKMDFFRAVLNRPRTRDRSKKILINQERHLIYLCDEFGSVATSGDQTGEAAFLDKAREFQCSCILAMQGLPSLLRKFSEKEVDALLQNCGMKIFLRNDDPSTNEYASRALGSEIKVRLNQNAGAMEHWVDMKKKWGARPYTTNYEKAPRYSPEQFVRFRVGEGVLRLPARFGESMVRKVHFDFNPISE